MTDIAGSSVVRSRLLREFEIVGIEISDKPVQLYPAISLCPYNQKDAADLKSYLQLIKTTHLTAEKTAATSFVPKLQ